MTTNEVTVTPLPSFSWRHCDNDGRELPEDEKCWWFTFDVGSNYIDFQLFADGTCEWFAISRPSEGPCTDPRGNDREPFDKVAADPLFTEAMEAIRRGYDAVRSRTP